MELQSSNPKLENQETELIYPFCVQELVSAKSLRGRRTRDDSGMNWRRSRHQDTEDQSREQDGNEKEKGHGDIDSDSLFPGWVKKGKRRRKRRARVRIPGFFQDDEVSRPGNEAAKPGKGKLPLKKRKMLESSVSDPGIGHSSSSGSRIFEPGDSKADDLTNPGAETAVVSISADEKSKNEHVCNICNRSFKSYQALGGHKAHHNNDKAGDISFTEGEDFNESTRPRKRNHAHQCTICRKIFSKGQALGGHKRHCRRRVGDGGAGEAENQFRTLDFDLNELPPEWISEV